MKKRLIFISSILLTITACGISLTNKWDYDYKKKFEDQYCIRSTAEGEKQCVCIINKVQSRYPDPIDFYVFQTDITKRADFLKYFRDDVEAGCLTPKS